MKAPETMKSAKEKVCACACVCVYSAEYLSCTE